MAAGPTPVTDVLDNGRHRLEGVASELRVQLAQRDQQLKQQYSLAAQEEGRRAEGKAMTKLEETTDRARQLHVSSFERSQELQQTTQQLGASESLLQEVERRERRTQQREEQRQERHSQLRRLEAEHRVQLEELRSDLRRATDHGNDRKTTLQKSLEQEQEETYRLEGRIAAAKAATETVAASGLRSRLETGMERLNTLEASIHTLRVDAGQKESQAAELLRRSAQLEYAAYERDKDIQVQSQLASSEERVQEVSQRFAHLRQADTPQPVDRSAHQQSGPVDAEAAHFNIRSSGERPVPADIQTQSPLDRERLQVQVAALRQAGDEAREHAAKMYQDYRDLRSRRDATRKPRDSENDNSSGSESAPSSPESHNFHRGISGFSLAGLPTEESEYRARRRELLEANRQGTQSSPGGRAEGLEAEIEYSESALDAKNRRLQLLSTLTTKNSSPQADDEGSEIAAWRSSVAASAGQRTDEFEALVMGLGVKLHDGEREVRQISMGWDGEGDVGPERQERDLLVQAQRQQLSAMDVALRCGDEGAGLPGGPEATLRREAGEHRGRARSNQHT